MTLLLPLTTQHWLTRRTTQDGIIVRDECVNTADGLLSVRRAQLRRDRPQPMDLNGTYRFASASPQAVWNALHNSAVLQSAIPGAEQIAWQGDSAIAARIKVGLGPINGTFGVQAQAVEQTPPNHLKLAINRQGASNTIQGQMTVDLAPDGAGTALTYQLAVALSGPIAMADNPLTKPLVQNMANQVFGNLEKQIG